MLSHLHWLYYLAVTFSKALPANMLAMIVLGLFSRVTSMLALLLPVKILLLVSNNSVPVFFPAFLQEMQLNTLILLLCGATILLYASSVGLEKLILGIERKAERLLVSKLAPTASDSHSIKTLKKVYGKVSGSLIDLCFIFGVFIFILFAYTILFITLFIYSSVVWGAYKLFASPIQRTDEVDEEVDEEDAKKDGLMTLWVDIGFLVSFLVVILGMLFDEGAGIMVTFICFLLLRRSSRGVKRFIKDLVIVYAQKTVLYPVLSDSVSVAELSGADSDKVLTKSNINSIISMAMRETFPGSEVSIASTAMFDHGDDMTCAYLVDATVSGSHDQFLVKLFHNKRQRAKVECELYRAISNLPVNGIVNHGNHHQAGWLLVNFSINHSCGATGTGMVADQDV